MPLRVSLPDIVHLPSDAPVFMAILLTADWFSLQVGCSGFVVSLCMQCQQDLAPYAGKSFISSRSIHSSESYNLAHY